MPNIKMCYCHSVTMQELREQRNSMDVLKNAQKCAKFFMWHFKAGKKKIFFIKCHSYNYLTICEKNKYDTFLISHQNKFRMFENFNG